jgi:hypothetical protein
MLSRILLIRDFFPIRLLIAQLKYNFFGLIFWVLLFAIATESLGSFFGVPFLFYSPEYLGEVNIWGFVLLGFSFGGFTMAFNTYSYAKLSPRFPFLIVVSTPFFRFCINNSILPLLFTGIYLYNMSIFQSKEELTEMMEIIWYNLSFVGGLIIFVLLSILYFFPLRKNRVKDDDEPDTNEQIIASLTNNKNEKWYNYFRAETKRPCYYIGKNFKIYKSRSVDHLEKDLIEQIYADNRINVFVFEAITILSFLGMGFFRNYTFFEMPAAMSILTLLTILAMLFSAFLAWFHRWGYPLIFGLIALMTYLSSVTPFFRYTSYAIGLDYAKDKRVEYSLAQIATNGKQQGDLTNSHIAINEILNNWKAKQKESKPKLIILNCSGGGSRSALWTFVVLSNCDSITNGTVSKQMQLIAGASGGMVGAAYYRELILRRNLGTLKTKSNQEFKRKISKDLLNKLAFSASTSDLLMRYKQFKYNNHSYTHERGVAFEQHLHQNLDYFLEHPLSYYKEYEQKSNIPLMIFSPTIIKDGRRLLMSSQNLSFMVGLRGGSSAYENIDYQTFFKRNNPGEIRFSSVLRANASFPFIMPMMTMPTKPEIQLMDAGIRDNYGGKVSVDYLFANSKWIEKNTSGVIILETRDTKRVLNDESYHEINLLDKITLPFGNIIINFPHTQDYDQEQLMKLCSNSFKFPVDIVTFNLRERYDDRISLSWRLTKREKQKIEQAFSSKENKLALEKLKNLLFH